MVTLLDAATSTEHPYNSMENSALQAFREQHVDLSEKDMTFGREVRDIVIRQCESPFRSNGFPLVLAGQSFLAGSFGRQTQAQPLNDIDLYLVMNAGGLQIWDADDQEWWGLEGRMQGPITDDPTLRLAGWVSADLVLQRVASGLRLLPLVRQNGLAVGINDKRKCAYIKIGGVNVDVSPVVWAKFTNTIDRYYMPMGQSSYAWKRTNPKEDQRRLSTQNQKQDGLLLPTIRMVKCWNEELNKGRLKGILLETIVEDGLSHSSSLVGLAQAVHLAFVNLQLALGRPPCPDPTRLGPPLDSHLSNEDRRVTIAAAAAADFHASQAANAFKAGNVAAGLRACDVPH
ncbi:MAG: hypothetical protein Q7T33_06845 [Dehalococcoidia bacterium]|nr:hypothetical protein [Dehalococcoidia bacterium]